MSSEREEGLSGIEEDRDVRQAIAMGEQGFATLRGKGSRNGIETRYSQTDAVAKERVDELPQDWDSISSLIKELLKGRLRRFLDENRAHRAVTISLAPSASGVPSAISS